VLVNGVFQASHGSPNPLFTPRGCQCPLFRVLDYIKSRREGFLQGRTSGFSSVGFLNPRVLELLRSPYCLPSFFFFRCACRCSLHARGLGFVLLAFLFWCSSFSPLSPFCRCPPTTGTPPSPYLRAHSSGTIPPLPPGLRQWGSVAPEKFFWQTVGPG